MRYSVTLLFSECIRSDACSVNSVSCSVTPNVFNEYSSLNVFRVGIGVCVELTRSVTPNVFSEHSSFQAILFSEHVQTPNTERTFIIHVEIQL